MSPKMGRPKAANPKGVQVTARLDRETLEKLDESAAIFKESRADAIRHGIDLLHKQATAKK